jgi:hypothetical protein
MSEKLIDLLALRDRVLDYLAQYSSGRIEIIADLTGMRRESLYAYVKRRSGLTHVEDLQRLQEWMIADRANEQELTRKQVQWLISNAEKKLRVSQRSDVSYSEYASWKRKLKRYRKIEQSVSNLTEK